MYITSIQVNVPIHWVFFLFNVHVSVHRNNIPIYIQQDATLHNLFYLETVLHVSGGNTTHQRERIQLYLQYLVFVHLSIYPLQHDK